MGQSQLTKLVVEKCAERLAEQGFRKRSGNKFAKSFLPGKLGVLGVSLALQVRRGARDAWPVVGVHHADVEQLIKRLDPDSPTSPRALTTTFAQPLRYVVPEEFRRRWLFDPENDLDAAAARLIDDFLKFGVPYIERHIDDDSLVKAIPTGSAPPLERAKRLAVIHAINNRIPLALDALQPLRNEIQEWTTARADSLYFIEHSRATSAIGRDVSTPLPHGTQA